MRLWISLPISEGQVAKTRGIDFGRQPIVWKMTKDYLILKIEGHMGWSGRGLQTYRPTTFYVLKLREKDLTQSLYDILVDFTIRKEKAW